MYKISCSRPSSVYHIHKFLGNDRIYATYLRCIRVKPIETTTKSKSLSFPCGNVDFSSELIIFSQVITDPDILLSISVVDWIYEFEDLKLLSISKICLASQFNVMITLHRNRFLNKKTNKIICRRWAILQGTLSAMCFVRLLSLRTHYRTDSCCGKNILFTTSSKRDIPIILAIDRIYVSRLGNIEYITIKIGFESEILPFAGDNFLCTSSKWILFSVVWER